MSKTYGPYSPRRRAGHIVFISGQVAPGVGSFKEEVKAVLEKLENVLKEAGSDRDKVVYVQVFVKDYSDEKFKEFNDVYVEFLESRGVKIKPARVFIGVADLPVGANVEITAVAEQKLFEG